MMQNILLALGLLLKLQAVFQDFYTATHATTMDTKSTEVDEETDPVHSLKLKPNSLQMLKLSSAEQM